MIHYEYICIQKDVHLVIISMLQPGIYPRKLGETTNNFVRS